MMESTEAVVAMDVRKKEDNPVYSKLYLIPLGASVTFLVGFITTYLISTYLGHVPYFFPYISDTGTTPPESSIFTICTTIGSLLLAIFGYIRYYQIKEYCKNQPADTNKLLRLNKIGAVCAILSCSGIFIAGSVQVTTDFAVHSIGALFAFGVGAVYHWTQTAASWYMRGPIVSLTTVKVRFVTCVLNTIVFFIALFALAKAEMEFKGTSRPKWGPEDGGWEFHVTSTITEWIIAVLITFFMLTFVPEFRKLRMTKPQVITV